MEELKSAAPAQPSIVINNENKSANVNTNVNRNRNSAGGYGHRGYPRNKMVALLLCVFFGWCGAHKFYDGNKTMGIVYIFTVGLFFIGWIVDIVMIAMRPATYYVSRDGRYLGR